MSRLKILHFPKEHRRNAGFFISGVFIIIDFSLWKVKNNKYINPKREYILDGCEENKLNEHKTSPVTEQERW